jgi:uncharacterized protein
MEEILASIRRIIADDDPARSAPLPAAEPQSAQPNSAAAVPAPEPAMPAEAEAEINAMIAQLQAASSRQAAATAAPSRVDVLDLTEEQVAPPAASGGRPDSPSREAAQSSVTRASEEPRRSSRESDRGLVSAATSAAVDSAFGTLAQTVLVQNARTLEDLVREMLRPMLKTWLDDNLPSLVERLVRAEIERVARGRG